MSAWVCLFVSMQGVSYSEPPTCHPRDPVTFTLPIRFQQVPDPVPGQFTLNAQFLLLANRNQWLDGDVNGMKDLNVDAAFSRGIYPFRFILVKLSVCSLFLFFSCS